MPNIKQLTLTSFSILVIKFSAFSLGPVHTGYQQLMTIESQEQGQGVQNVWTLSKTRLLKNNWPKKNSTTNTEVPDFLQI